MNIMNNKYRIKLSGAKSLRDDTLLTVGFNLRRIVKYVMLSGVVMTLLSCKYDTDYRDADYPEQVIYMPAAYPDGQFVIDDVSRKIGELPFPGNPYRYVLDMEKGEFRVPLSVYRGGANKKGAFTVNVRVNTDIVFKINEDLVDKMLLIPSDKYSIVNSVEMNDGEEVATFDLVVDIDLLRDNYPNGVFAVGIEISSGERETNPALSTVVVIIHSKIMKPTANFTFSVDFANANTIHFRNTSQMAIAYQWDFGDGTLVSNEESPSHDFLPDGIYEVSLTATGITGDIDVMSAMIVLRDSPPTLEEQLSEIGGLVGLWEFNSPNFETATVGKDLATYYVASNNTNTIGVLSTDGIRPVSGYREDDFAVERDLRYQFLCEHGIPGDGGYVNEYTIMWDVKIPDPIVGWGYTLLQTGLANNTAPDIMLNPRGDAGSTIAIEAAGVYTAAGAIHGETWHRIIFVMNGNAPYYRVYVDGVKHIDMDYNASAPQLKLEKEGMLLFGSNTGGNNNRMHVSTVAIWDRVISDEDAAIISTAGGF